MGTSPLLQPFAPHPLTDREYWQAIRSNPALDKLLAAMTDGLDQIPPAPTLPQASDYLAARRFNDRNRVDFAWGRLRQQLASLTLNRCLRGMDPADPDDRLLDWLWALLNMPTWVLSAHLPKMDLPAAGSPQLDLIACETAAGMAETLEVLQPWINSVSGTLQQSIIAEIDRRVLTPFVQGPDLPGWAKEEPSPGRNNWTGVCAGVILVACEALARLGHPRPEARERALRLLRIFFDEAFTPAGECDEGIGYWSYGVGMACLGLMRLPAEEVRDRIGAERLAQVAGYPGRVYLFDHCFYSANDADMWARASVHFVPWLAELTGDRFLWHWVRTSGQTHRLGILSALREIETRCRGDALLSRASSYVPPAVRELPDQQVLIVRRGRLTVAIGGGTNAERHNHNDLGHFIAAVDSQVIIPDLGAPYYAADFFGSRRYTYLPASSRGHCCPLINGQEQRAGSDAAGTVLERQIDDQSPRYLLDLTSAYPSGAGLRRWTRGLSAEGDAIVIEDVIDCPAVALPAVRHVLWSVAKPAIDGASLRLDSLKVTLDPPPAKLRVVEVNADDLRLRSLAGRTLYRIDADYDTDGTGPIRFFTRLEV